MQIEFEQLMRTGIDVLQQESLAIHELSSKINTDFIKACTTILKCEARVIVTGVGKSAHIGRKMAATFASTGTPSIFVHAGEASHGDMGMFTRHDVAILISNSGETEEINRIIPIIKKLEIPLITITGNPNSSLSQAADVNLNIGPVKEACKLGLAPTTSTTLTLALGDALAVAVLEAKGFTKKDFAFSHPGGQLGRRLILKIKDIMKKDELIPTVYEEDTLKDALCEISEKCLGMTIVLNQNNEISGMFTDGDLRRYLEKNNDLNIKMKNIMNKNVTTVKQNDLAINAFQLIQDKKINSFPVVDENKKLVGALNFHSLLNEKII